MMFKTSIVQQRVAMAHTENDEPRFGARMLEKMGWQAGKGLGRHEDGIKDFIKVHTKNNLKGIGYRERDDQWMAHQEDFNKLLNVLNGNVVTSKPCKMKSLVEKSKSSHSRVHYNKFTRGKDLSSCSEKDLACIFGKRSTTNEDTNEYNNGERESNNTISRINMKDYFSKKLATIKAVEQQTRNQDSNDLHLPPNDFLLGDEPQAEDAVTCDMTKKKRKKKHKLQENTSDISYAEAQQDENERWCEPKRTLFEDNEEIIVDARGTTRLQEDKPRRRKKVTPKNNEEPSVPTTIACEPPMSPPPDISALEPETASSNIKLSPEESVIDLLISEPRTSQRTELLLKMLKGINVFKGSKFFEISGYGQ